MNSSGAPSPARSSHLRGSGAEARRRAAAARAFLLWSPPLRYKMADGVARSRRGLSPPPSPRGTPAGGGGGGTRGGSRPPARRFANRSAPLRAVRPISAADSRGAFRRPPPRPSARSEERTPIGRSRPDSFLALGPMRAGGRLGRSMRPGDQQALAARDGQSARGRKRKWRGAPKGARSHGEGRGGAAPPQWC